MLSQPSIGARLAFTFLAYGLAGCGSSGPALPETYAVTGSVSQDGKPMKGGSIQFRSDSDPMLRVMGEIQEDGTFTLNTVKDDLTGKGVPEGEYHVIVQPPLEKDTSGGIEVAHKGVPPITLAKTVKVEPKENRLTIELP